MLAGEDPLKIVSVGPAPAQLPDPLELVLWFEVCARDGLLSFLPLLRASLAQPTPIAYCLHASLRVTQCA